MYYELVFHQKWWFKVKTPWWICFFTCSFSLHKTLIDRLESCGLLVDYFDVFISCLDSHSDGTHSLQTHRIHWWASDVMTNFSKSVLMQKQTHLHLGWPEYIFICGWTVPLMHVIAIRLTCITRAESQSFDAEMGLWFLIMTLSELWTKGPGALTVIWDKDTDLSLTIFSFRRSSSLIFWAQIYSQR